ncbi:glycine--tRNA ligase subunit beta [Fertoebacter nigrum]|uniref:Glycine--tRNA ligase beta subunit n=1 Tax=Fertoeibacter niger TaxID=2656921 RepID=A0A8X8H086_9RHOB|nr:glycine--tRNA ligase subunit beta [Fertoeibacter niger]NUB45148.1 glycine--tRNA ligase subunit beta [Fertoeibacter niger]
MPDLLLELFSEEIPARMQARAAADLKKLVTDGLVGAGLTYAGAGAFSTPRRLVLAVEGMLAASPTQREERKGPKADAPAAALQGFLRGLGIEDAAPVLALAGQPAGAHVHLAGVRVEIRDDKKGQVFFAVLQRPGRPAAEIVAEVVVQAISNFPWPKSMRWGESNLRWVRPLHSILCILHDEGGASVVPLTVDPLVAGSPVKGHHITAGNTTEGHRFMAPGRFPVSSFADYAAKLKRACVVLDPAEREAAIWHDATTQAFALGLEVVPDPALLAEVAGLVEWPVVLLGRIGAAFLDLPPEVLQTSMREHQKFFSVKNPRTGRIEGFVTVANRDTADQGATILAGNQKVLSARLSDAKFFWENDLRTVHAVGLVGMAAGLASVTFHNKLGSEADRITRIAALAREIAPLVGADPDLAEQAAKVAKADLQSAMVGEFPELQGTMGGYYARALGLPEPVAAACKAHYSPLGPSDDVPSDPVSVAVALADKIDTLTGFWAIDEKPTGSKDPFALRRAALGVVRLVLDNGLRFSVDRLFDVQVLRHQIGHTPAEPELLSRILSAAVADGMFGTTTRALIAETAALGWLPLLRDHDPGVSDDLRGFLHDRLKVYLKDQSIRHDIIDACLAMPDNCDLTLLVKRAQSLAAFLKTEDGANLLQGFKRANNILTQAEAKDGVEYSFGADIKYAETDEERALFAALDTAEKSIAPAMADEDFAAAMAALAGLRQPIDAFFDAVQVNSDKQVIRRNRLNLLHRIRAACAPVADLTRIEG